MIGLLLVIWIQQSPGGSTNDILIGRIQWEIEALKKDVDVIQANGKTTADIERRVRDLEHEVKNRPTMWEIIQSAGYVLGVIGGLLGSGWIVKKRFDKEGK